MDTEKLAISTFYGAIICALAAGIVPWLVRIFSRRLAGAIAVVLAMAATILFLVCNSNMPSGDYIRPDLCFTPLLLLGVWLQGIILTVGAFRRKPD